MIKQAYLKHITRKLIEDFSHLALIQYCLAKSPKLHAGIHVGTRNQQQPATCVYNHKEATHA